MAEYPDEFRIDTAAARPLSMDEKLNQLDELLRMRGALGKASQELFQFKADAESEQEAAQKDRLKLLQSLVGIVDDLRRLLDDAHRNLGVKKGAGGMLTRWFGGADRSSEGQDAAQAWLEAFGRLLSAALGQLESREVHHIPLLGRDLKELTFEGQSVKPWVAVKNKPKGGRLVVVEEIRGLWIEKRANQLLPIQRAEVLV